MIIDRSDCDVGLPSLTLESYSPSPLLHMKMQSELISKLSDRFILPKLVIEPADVQEYQGMMEDWMSKFPPTYNLAGPDISQDKSHPWIILHRHYLRTMAYSMTLDPIRAYLAKPLNSSSPGVELQIRNDGIGYALKLMDALQGFFDHVWPRDAKFHFVIFSIFDTAAVYSSVIMHDEDNTAPKREEMLRAMEDALEMMKRLMTAIPAAQLYHDILTRLHKKIQKKLGILKPGDGHRKKAKLNIKALPSPDPVDPLSGASVSSLEISSDENSASSVLILPPAPAQPQAEIMYRGIPEPAPVNDGYGFHPTPFLSDYWSSNGTAIYSQPMPSVGGNGTYVVETLPGPTGTSLPTTPVEDQLPDMGFSSMSTEELGELADLWRWQSLDLDLIHQEQTMG